MEETTGAPPAKRQKTEVAVSSTKAGSAPQAHLLKTFEPSRHMTFKDPFLNQSCGVRLVTIRDDHGKALLLIVESARVDLKYGVTVPTLGKNDKLNLQFKINDQKEHDILDGIVRYVIEQAKKKKEEWWPGETVKDDLIEDNAVPIVSKRTPIPESKRKKGGLTTYPGNMKVSIPLDADGKLKGCVVLDENGEPVADLYSIAGRTVTKLMFELGGLYFQKKNLAFGPKTLRFLQLAPDMYGGGARSSENIDYAQVAAGGVGGGGDAGDAAYDSATYASLATAASDSTAE